MTILSCNPNLGEYEFCCDASLSSNSHEAGPAHLDVTTRDQLSSSAAMTHPVLRGTTTITHKT